MRADCMQVLSSLDSKPGFDISMQLYWDYQHVVLGQVGFAFYGFAGGLHFPACGKLAVQGPWEFPVGRINQIQIQIK